jgi:hypothetical protein
MRQDQTDKPFCTTEEFAGRLNLRPQSVRAALCREGSYYGVKPLKAANGRLLWPTELLKKLTGGGDA